MLYSLVKLLTRPALKIFCPQIMVEQRDKTRASGPILIVANHPNSFFDAILIGSLFKKPVHFLARGDAFKKSWHRKMLSALNMIPVYRLSEGKENLGLNDFAFRRSKEVLSAKGIVLIFIEGICVHKHELQPFKKGAARIVLENKDLPGFRVLPVGLAYNSFVKFGKKINILFGDFYEARDLVPYEQAPQNFRNFNFQMQEVLTKKFVSRKSKKQMRIFCS